MYPFSKRQRTISRSTGGGSFIQYIMGKVSIGNPHIIGLIIYNSPKNFNEPEQLFNENNDGISWMVQEAAKDSSQRVKI